MNRCFFKGIPLVLLFLFLLGTVAGCGGRTGTPDTPGMAAGSESAEPAARSMVDSFIWN